MFEVEGIVDKIEKMPSLSPTVSKVIEVANNMNSSPRELVTVIKMDPILTGKVLKLVNSAYFALSQEVTSLERAIIMLGLNTIKNMTLTTAVLEQFSSKQFKNAGFNIDEFWKHSLGVAVASKILAEKFDIPKKFREEFFIGGLLHDIGKLILARYYPNEMNSILKQTKELKIPILTIENRELQFTHPEIGEKIAQKWKLSNALIKAIASHHGPDYNEWKSEEFKLIASVYIANNYCIFNKIGESGDELYIEINPIMWKILRITKQECFDSLLVVTAELQKAMEFLKIVS